MTKSGLSDPSHKWAGISENPSLLLTSAGVGWRGFEFEENTFSGEGAFDGEEVGKNMICIYQTFGTVQNRINGRRSSFKKFPSNAMLVLPRDRCAGHWLGQHRAQHLFIEIDAFERLCHLPFREDAFDMSKGPDLVVTSLLQALHIDMSHGHLSGPLMGESVVTALLHHLLGGDGEMSSTSVPRDMSSHAIERVCEWIDAHLARPFSLEDLAAEANVSVRHLQRAFPAATGFSPYKYVLTRRVEEAKRLIRAGGLSLSEVATATGFHDQAHMAHTFRKVIGIPPSHFRNTAV